MSHSLSVESVGLLLLLLTSQKVPSKRSPIMCGKKLMRGEKTVDYLILIQLLNFFTSESPDAGVDCAGELSATALSNLRSHS